MYSVVSEQFVLYQYLSFQKVSYQSIDVYWMHDLVQIWILFDIYDHIMVSSKLYENCDNTYWRDCTLQAILRGERMKWNYFIIRRHCRTKDDVKKNPQYLENPRILWKSSQQSFFLNDVNHSYICKIFFRLWYENQEYLNIGYKMKWIKYLTL